MAARIEHRGPDDKGFFIDLESGIGLAHRRLSILDPSAAGHQPMPDAADRYVICYNGELYNYPEIRTELVDRGVVFHSHCDTEALLELFARDGVECFARLNGIFALAIWDKAQRRLTLARDGAGVKPLYFTETPSGFAFASEIKALLELPDLDRTTDSTAAVAYLSYLWSPGERTMLKAVKKLEPGTWLSLTRSGGRRSGRFYAFPPYAPVSRSDEELIAGTRQALAAAVERQMLADVDVGAFLSGGLDSSALIAFARQHTGGRPLQCFTIHYEDRAGKAGEMVSDLPFARTAARHLGVELNEVRVDAGIAADFERLIYHLDEPQADPASINSLYICELARKSGIKVLLSGTGGDDVFTGYRRHTAARFDDFWNRVPASLRGVLAGGARMLPTRTTTLRRLRKLLGGVDASSEARLTGYFEWLPPEAAADLIREAGAAEAAAARAPLEAVLTDSAAMPAVERVLRLDQNFFLPDHNLNYADKTGMAAGVEIRVPFLDRELVDWAASVPLSAKIRGGSTKWVLRKAMEPMLPPAIISRPKTGFGVPLRTWMRSDLRPMAEELLAPASVAARGLFDSAQVACLKDDTMSGRRDGSYTLLGIMAMELWARRFLDVSPAPLRANAPSNA
jgi:asparagine synthase (glutamine-hydrolysing)